MISLSYLTHPSCGHADELQHPVWGVDGDGQPGGVRAAGVDHAAAGAVLSDPGVTGDGRDDAAACAGCDDFGGTERDGGKGCAGEFDDGAGFVRDVRSNAGGFCGVRHGGELLAGFADGDADEYDGGDSHASLHADEQ